MPSNEYMRTYMLNRYHSRRAEAIESLGNNCAMCDISGLLEPLEFDHIDPSQKTYNISKVWSFSEFKFWEEIKKCQLLCNDCHKEKHESKAEHGTVQRYWRDCRCDPCTKANSEYSKEYKRLRRTVA